MFKDIAPMRFLKEKNDLILILRITKIDMQ